ncbi:MAG: CooT family nickel-binding protein [Trichloromonadaceae bacterium]
MDHGSFVLINGDREISLENISSVTIVGNELRMIDIFGKTSDLDGRISEIDLLNRRIVLA